MDCELATLKSPYEQNEERYTVRIFRYCISPCNWSPSDCEIADTEGGLYNPSFAFCSAYS